MKAKNITEFLHSKPSLGEVMILKRGDLIRISDMLGVITKLWGEGFYFFRHPNRNKVYYRRRKILAEIKKGELGI